MTFTTQSSPAGANTWTTFSDVNTLAETSTATSYDLRVVVCDALGNCANSTGFPAIAPNTSTAVVTQFGVDLTAPTFSTTAAPKANEIVGAGGALSSGTNVSVLPTDPQGANAAFGSGFGATPVLVSETRLSPSGAAGQQQACVIGAGAADGTCSAPNIQNLTFPIQNVPGQYALTYTVTDQAGNTAPAIVTNYYIDIAAPAVSGGISIPASITVGSTFTSSGVDDMDFASANAFLHYSTGAGTGNIVLPATSSAAGVAFDNTLTRTSTVTATLPANQFYRSLGSISGVLPGTITVVPSVKPDIVGIRGLDAANNLSLPNTASLPIANIAQAATFPNTFVVGTELADFNVTSDVASVHNATTNTTTPRSATFTATVSAVNAMGGSPFTSVCFYLQSPDGAEGGAAGTVTKAGVNDLVLLGCSSTFTTTPTGTTGKQISTTLTFDPDAAFGTAGSLTVFAIGSNAAGDALLTTGTSFLLIP